MQDSYDNVELATKSDLKILETRLDTRFAEMKGEMLLLKWMVGVIVAGTIALVLKAFF